MSLTRRFSSLGVLRLTACVVSFSLLTSSTLTASSPTGGATATNPGFGLSSGQPAGMLYAPRRIFASFMHLFQSSGFPSVPGSNLPDLDAARAVPPSDPAAPAAIASDQACTDCTPCPTCGPGTTNHAPGVDAGGPYYGTAGAAIVTNGLGSFDIDAGDNISVYAWSFGDGSGVFNGPTPAHTYQSAGNYTISLTVTDTHNATATIGTTASIMPAPPSVPPSGTTQGNAALFIVQSAPATMTAGQSYPVSVTVRNTGTTTWTREHLYRLGSQSPQDNSLWGQPRVYLPTAVAPGADVTFSFVVVAPYNGNEQPPPAQFRWRMVEDGVEWFGDYTTDQTITITSNYQAPNPGAPQYGPFSNLFVSRLAPDHRTGQPGEDLLSGNYNWAVGLVALPGRSEMDLNLGLSYNSQAAWTKVVPPVTSGGRLQAPSFTFDADRGFPSAGFRLGFPTIQGPFSNPQTNGSSYLMLLPSGGRVELRRVGTTNLYEATDSSYAQLVDSGNGSLLVRSTDGSQLAYWSINSEYRCTEVKDRNGNYLTIKYDPINGTANLGRITSIIDTLGRTLNFTYDSNFRLQSITQLRNGQTHVWASFGYTALTITTNFTAPSGPAPVVLGLPQNHIVSVLTQVGLDDGSRYTYEYGSWGQVYRIKHFAADGHQLNYVSYNLPLTNSTAQSDCPRFSQRQDVVENWNDNNPATTNFQSDPNGAWNQETAPDGSTYREYATKAYADWKRGLVTKTETYSSDNASVPKKTTITDWTQDVTNVSYPLNSRATATTISDAEGNRRRTTIEYAAFGLPSDVYELGPYGTSDWRVLRRTHVDYNLSAPYLNRRVIGLVAAQYLFAPDSPNSSSIQTLVTKTTLEYDAGGEFLQSQGNPVQSDAANYGTGLLEGRGNVTQVRRWDVTHETELNQALVSSIGHNTTGSTIFLRDPLGHQSTISYQDSFSSNGVDSTTLAFTALAYPTMITDPDGFSSTARYHYDLGRQTRQQDPKGAAQTTSFDAAGRVKQVTNSVNGAYQRFVYPANQTIVNRFATIQEGQGEAYSATVFDGAARVRATAADSPNSTGHYSGKLTVYDSLGQAIQETNPTEMSNQWVAAGDDYAGWISTLQSYDWKGRPALITNPSLTSDPNETTTKEASYGGCGCAGGSVITLTDEGTEVNGSTKKRQQRIFSDSLGRTIKSQILNWDGPGSFGTGGTVYSTTVYTYNAQDRVTLVRQFQGGGPSDLSDLSCPTGTCQQTAMSYDGFGRLRTEHFPRQAANTATTYDYWNDDTVKKATDARGAAASFGYNGRQLLTNITYSAPAGITPAAPVTYAYDETGNRTLMSDGLGSTTYHFDTQSRMEWEERYFSDLSASYRLNYSYNIGGELTGINDQTFGTTVSYAYDATGRSTQINSSGFPGVSQFASNLKYRAWGGLKETQFGNGQSLTVNYNSRLLPSSYSIASVISKVYQYHPDARLKYSQDLGDARYDRKDLYDQVASLTTALSGAEARGQSVTDNRPYNQVYQHDTFGNLTNRVGQQWAHNSFSEPATYNDDRRVGWNYDASGNWLDEGTSNSLQRKYDAAGRLVKLIHPAFPNNPKRTDDFDGNGERLRSGYHTSQPEYLLPLEYTFYLRSTVLGGQIVDEIKAGQKSMGYVYYPSGDVLAVQKLATVDDVAAYVLWRHTDPASLSVRVTDANGSAVGYLQDRFNSELDPLGADNALEDPGELELYNAPDDFNPGWLLPSSAGGKCKLDGMPIDCSELSEKMELGFVDAEYLKMGRNDKAPPQLHPIHKPNPQDERRLTLVHASIRSFGLGLSVTDFPVDRSDNEGRHIDSESGFINLPHEPAQAELNHSRSTKSSSKACDDIRNILLGNWNIKAALDDAFDKSVAGSREQGGLLGESVDYEQTRQGGWIAEPFQRKGGNANRLPDFINWANKKINAGSDATGYRFWYHTHPFNVGDQVPGFGRQQQPPEIPSGDDVYTSQKTGLLGIIVSEKSLVVFDKNGSEQCRFAR